MNYYYLCYKYMNHYSPLEIINLSSPVIVNTDSPILSVSSPVIKLNPTIRLTSSDDDDYVTSINLTYSKPQIGVYKNLNNDPRTREIITKYFITKTLDKWLLKEFKHLLNYFRVDGKGVVDVIGNMNEYKQDGKIPPEHVKKIIDFIEQYFLNMAIMKKILNSYAQKSDTQWIHLYKKQYYVKNEIANRLLKMIEEAIKSKKKFSN